jgi:hypothetical protein
MTALTRRDALLLTAAATTISAAVQSAAVADDQPAPAQTDNSILEVPSGVADASSIPITLRIPAKDIDLKKGDSLTNVTIDLKLQKAQNQDPKKDDNTNMRQVFTATLNSGALPTDSNGDVLVMTSLKIVYDPFGPAPPPPQVAANPPPPPPSPPTQFTVYLRATINITYDKANPKTKTYIAQQSIALLLQDCPPSNAAVLRLGLQPANVPDGNPTLLRAILPATAMPYLLNTITCTKPNDASAAAFQLTPAQQNVYVRQNGGYVSQNGVYLADETSASVNLYPQAEGVITMTWDYQNTSAAAGAPKVDLIASAYVTIKPRPTQ